MARAVRILLLGALLPLAFSASNAVSADGVGVWLKHLRSHDLGERLSAAYRVEPGTGNSDESVGALIVALRDRDAFVRQHVAAVLGDLPGHTDSIIAALIGLLRDSDPGVCSQAAVGLAKRGPAAVPALIRALQDTRAIGADHAIGRFEQTAPAASDYAAVALARMDAPIFPSLADAYVAIRKRYALRGLGTAKRPYDLHSVQPRWDPGRMEVSDLRRTVTRRFSPTYFRESVVHIMAGRPSTLDLPAALSYLGGADARDSDLGLLIAGINWGNSDDAIVLLGTAYRKYSTADVHIAVLDNILDSIIESSINTKPGRAEILSILLSALRDPRPSVRESAVKVIPWEKEILSQAGEVFEEELLQCLADPLPSLRALCARSLGWLIKAPNTDEKLVRLLVKVLRTDSSDEVRDAAAYSLAGIEFPFEFVQESLLEMEREGRLGNTGENTLGILFQNVRPAAAVLSKLISQLEGEDPKLRARALQTLAGIKPLPRPAVKPLVAALRQSYGSKGENTDERSFGEDAVRTLAEGAPEETETMEAFAEILHLATRRPSPEVQRLGGLILFFLDKFASPNAALRDAVVAYGEEVDAAAVTPMLMRTGAPGLAVLVNRISSVQAAEKDSWFPCLALRDVSGPDKANFVPRLLNMMRDDQSATGACAAAALAGTSQERVALLRLLARYWALWPVRDQRAVEVEFLKNCIEGPVWDWTNAALDEIAASNKNPEPLVELFESETKTAHSRTAALKRAIEDRTGRLRGVAEAILDWMIHNYVIPEDPQDFSYALNEGIAYPEFREKIMSLVAELASREPELIDSTLHANPWLEPELAAEVHDSKPDADLALVFLGRLQSPSLATVEAVKNYIEANMGTIAEWSGPLDHGCEAVRGWAQAGAAAAHALKPLLSSKNYQWCAIQAMAGALPADAELPALLADVALHSESQDLRLMAASEALGLRAPLGDFEALYQAVILDQKIAEWIAADISGVADALRPWIPPRGWKKAAAPSRLPPFPWPPPRWSYLGVFGRDCPRSLLGDDHTTLDALYKRLYQALKSIDPNFETGLFGAPGGFALLVKPERVNEDGSPLPLKYRWSEGKVPPLSVADYIAHLFTQPIGYFRAMVFIVTDQAEFEGGNQSLPDFDTGAAELPDEIGTQELKDKHIFALIYSWKRDWDQPPMLISRELSALTHLQKSGIIAALEQGN